MDNALKAAIIVGGAAVVAAFVPIAFANHLFSSGDTTPSTSPPGASASATTATGALSRPAPDTTSPPVYYRGNVTITNNGLDFDIKPPGPGPGTAAFYYDSSLITSSSTGGFAVWKQGTPTASECKSFEPSNRVTDLGNVVDGMQICFRTDQGRFGLLSVNGSTSYEQLQAYAIVWGP